MAIDTTRLTNDIRPGLLEDLTERDAQITSEITQAEQDISLARTRIESLREEQHKIQNGIRALKEKQ
jgi:FtsZ-binding cell division protein ZapB